MPVPEYVVLNRDEDGTASKLFMINVLMFLFVNNKAIVYN